MTLPHLYWKGLSSIMRDNQDVSSIPNHPHTTTILPQQLTTIIRQLIRTPRQLSIIIRQLICIPRRPTPRTRSHSSRFYEDSSSYNKTPARFLSPPCLAYSLLYLIYLIFLAICFLTATQATLATMSNEFDHIISLQTNNNNNVFPSGMCQTPTSTCVDYPDINDSNPLTYSCQLAKWGFGPFSPGVKQCQPTTPIIKSIERRFGDGWAPLQITGATNTFQDDLIRLTFLRPLYQPLSLYTGDSTSPNARFNVALSTQFPPTRVNPTSATSAVTQVVFQITSTWINNFSSFPSLYIEHSPTSAPSTSNIIEYTGFSIYPDSNPCLLFFLHDDDTRLSRDPSHFIDCNLATGRLTCTTGWQLPWCATFIPGFKLSQYYPLVSLRDPEPIYLSSFVDLFINHWTTSDVTCGFVTTASIGTSNENWIFSTLCTPDNWNNVPIFTLGNIADIPHLIPPPVSPDLFPLSIGTYSPISVSISTKMVSLTTNQVWYGAKYQILNDCTAHTVPCHPLNTLTCIPKRPTYPSPTFPLKLPPLLPRQLVPLEHAPFYCKCKPEFYQHLDTLKQLDPNPFSLRYNTLTCGEAFRPIKPSLTSLSTQFGLNPTQTGLTSIIALPKQPIEWEFATLPPQFTPSPIFPNSLLSLDFTTISLPLSPTVRTTPAISAYSTTTAIFRYAYDTKLRPILEPKPALLVYRLGSLFRGPLLQSKLFRHLPPSYDDYLFDVPAYPPGQHGRCPPDYYGTYCEVFLKNTDPTRRTLTFFDEISFDLQFIGYTAPPEIQCHLTPEYPGLFYTTSLPSSGYHLQRIAQIIGLDFWTYHGPTLPTGSIFTFYPTCKVLYRHLSANLQAEMNFIVNFDQIGQVYTMTKECRSRCHSENTKSCSLNYSQSNSNPGWVENLTCNCHTAIQPFVYDKLCSTFQILETRVTNQGVLSLDYNLPISFKLSPALYNPRQNNYFLLFTPLQTALGPSQQPYREYIHRTSDYDETQGPPENEMTPYYTLPGGPDGLLVTNTFVPSLLLSPGLYNITLWYTPSQSASLQRPYFLSLYSSRLQVLLDHLEWVTPTQLLIKWQPPRRPLQSSTLYYHFGTIRNNQCQLFLPLIIDIPTSTITESSHFLPFMTPQVTTVHQYLVPETLNQVILDLTLYADAVTQTLCMEAVNVYAHNLNLMPPLPPEYTPSFNFTTGSEFYYSTSFNFTWSSDIIAYRCLNGGVYLPGKLDNAFRCECPEGFFGYYCQLVDLQSNMSGISDSNPIQFTPQSSPSASFDGFTPIDSAYLSVQDDKHPSTSNINTSSTVLTTAEASCSLRCPSAMTIDSSCKQCICTTDFCRKTVRVFSFEPEVITSPSPRFTYPPLKLNPNKETEPTVYTREKLERVVSPLGRGLLSHPLITLFETEISLLLGLTQLPPSTLYTHLDTPLGAFVTSDPYGPRETVNPSSLTSPPLGVESLFFHPIDAPMPVSNSGSRVHQSLIMLCYLQILPYPTNLATPYATFQARFDQLQATLRQLASAYSPLVTPLDFYPSPASINPQVSELVFQPVGARIFGTYAEDQAFYFPSTITLYPLTLDVPSVVTLCSAPNHPLQICPLATPDAVAASIFWSECSRGTRSLNPRCYIVLHPTHVVNIPQDRCSDQWPYYPKPTTVGCLVSSAGGFPKLGPPRLVSMVNPREPIKKLSPGDSISISWDYQGPDFYNIVISFDMHYQLKNNSLDSPESGESVISPPNGAERDGEGENDKESTSTPPQGYQTFTYPDHYVITTIPARDALAVLTIPQQLNRITGSDETSVFIRVRLSLQQSLKTTSLSIEEIEITPPNLCITKNIDCSFVPFSQCDKVTGTCQCTHPYHHITNTLFLNPNIGTTQRPFFVKRNAMRHAITLPGEEPSKNDMCIIPCYQGFFDPASQSCICFKGFTGIRCETKVDECEHNHPNSRFLTYTSSYCSDQGYHQDSCQTNICICLNNFQGIMCSQCSLDTMKICSRDGTNWTLTKQACLACICNFGYHGEQCQYFRIIVAIDYIQPYSSENILKLGLLEADDKTDANVKNLHTNHFTSTQITPTPTSRLMTNKQVLTTNENLTMDYIFTLLSLETELELQFDYSNNTRIIAPSPLSSPTLYSKAEYDLAVTLALQQENVKVIQSITQIVNSTEGTIEPRINHTLIFALTSLTPNTQLESYSMSFYTSDAYIPDPLTPRTLQSGLPFATSLEDQKHQPQHELRSSGSLFNTAQQVTIGLSGSYLNTDLSTLAPAAKSSLPPTHDRSRLTRLWTDLTKAWFSSHISSSSLQETLGVMQSPMISYDPNCTEQMEQQSLCSRQGINPLTNLIPRVPDPPSPPSITPQKKSINPKKYLLPLFTISVALMFVYATLMSFISVVKSFILLVICRDGDLFNLECSQYFFTVGRVQEITFRHYHEQLLEHYRKNFKIPSPRTIADRIKALQKQELDDYYAKNGLTNPIIQDIGFSYPFLGPLPAPLPYPPLLMISYDQIVHEAMVQSSISRAAQAPPQKKQVFRDPLEYNFVAIPIPHLLHEVYYQIPTDFRTTGAQYYSSSLLFSWAALLLRPFGIIWSPSKPKPHFGSMVFCCYSRNKQQYGSPTEHPADDDDEQDDDEEDDFDDDYYYGGYDFEAHIARNDDDVSITRDEHGVSPYDGHGVSTLAPPETLTASAYNSLQSATLALPSPSSPVHFSDTGTFPPHMQSERHYDSKTKYRPRRALRRLNRIKNRKTGFSDYHYFITQPFDIKQARHDLEKFEHNLLYKPTSTHLRSTNRNGMTQQRRVEFKRQGEHSNAVHINIEERSVGTLNGNDNDNDNINNSNNIRTSNIVRIAGQFPGPLIYLGDDGNGGNIGDIAGSSAQHSPPTPHDESPNDIDSPNMDQFHPYTHQYLQNSERMGFYYDFHPSSMTHRQLLQDQLEEDRLENLKNRASEHLSVFANTPQIPKTHLISVNSTTRDRYKDNRDMAAQGQHVIFSQHVDSQVIDPEPDFDSVFDPLSRAMAFSNRPLLSRRRDLQMRQLATLSYRLAGFKSSKFRQSSRFRRQQQLHKRILLERRRLAKYKQSQEMLQKDPFGTHLPSIQVHSPLSYTGYRFNLPATITPQPITKNKAAKIKHTSILPQSIPATILTAFNGPVFCYKSIPENFVSSTHCEIPDAICITPQITNLADHFFPLYFDPTITYTLKYDPNNPKVPALHVIPPPHRNWNKYHARSLLYIEILKENQAKWALYQEDWDRYQKEKVEYDRQMAIQAEIDRIAAAIAREQRLAAKRQKKTRKTKRRVKPFPQDQSSPSFSQPLPIQQDPLKTQSQSNTKEYDNICTSKRDLSPQNTPVRESSLNNTTKDSLPPTVTATTTAPMETMTTTSTTTTMMSDLPPQHLHEISNVSNNSSRNKQPKPNLKLSKSNNSISRRSLPSAKKTLIKPQLLVPYPPPIPPAPSTVSIFPRTIHPRFLNNYQRYLLYVESQVYRLNRRYHKSRHTRPMVRVGSPQQPFNASLYQGDLRPHTRLPNRKFRNQLLLPQHLPKR